MTRRQLTPRKIGLRLLRHRLRHAAVLAVAGLILSTTTCGLAALRSSALAATEASVQADRANLEYAIQAGTPAALEALSAVDGLTPVRDEDASLSAGGRELPVQLRSSSRSGVALGTLVGGERAKAGEITVSRHVASILDVAVGDAVDVSVENGGSRDLIVAGITVNSADVEDTTVVTVDPQMAAKDTTAWLTADDPYQNPSLQPFLDTRTITYQSSAPLVAAAQDALPPELSALKLLPAALAFFLLLLIAGAALAMSGTAIGDVRVLAASGMSAKGAWKIVIVVAIGSLLSGMVAGFIAVWAGLSWAKRPLSWSFGQDWTHVSVPAIPFLFLCLVVMAGAALAFASTQRFGYLWDRLVSRRRATAAAWLPGLSLATGAVLLIVALLAHNKTPPGNLSAIGPYAAALVAVSIPWLVANMVGRGLPRATGRVVERLVASGMAAFVIAALIATLSSAASARRSHDANAFESKTDAPQPAGSLLVNEVPDDAGELLVRRFEELGGSDVARYLLPDESKFRVRATGPRLLQCMADIGTLTPDAVDAECFPQQTMSPVNTVALTTSTEPLADPGLVEDGLTGLLIFKEMTAAASSLAETEATADARLGGNMPGLVLPVDGPTAKRIGLVAGGTSIVALLDFHSLTQVRQAEMRGLISRIAPAAQVADSASRSHYDTERTISAGVAVLGAALSMLVALAGGAAVLVGERQTLLTLVDVGGVTRLRLRIVGRWAAVGVLTALLILPLSRFAADVAGVNATGAVGYWWLAPPITMALSCGALIVLAMGGVRSVRE